MVEPVPNERVVCFIERLGDRIMVKYMAENYMRANPDHRLHCLEQFNYPSVHGFTMKEWAPDLFKGGFYESGDKINGQVLTSANFYSLKGVPRLYPVPGNLFVYTPQKIRETGIYPTLRIPPAYRTWLSGYLPVEIIREYDRPIVCFHILTDAPYSKSRNHSFPHWKECIEKLADQDVWIIRIGLKETSQGVVGHGKANVFDFSQDDLTTPQAISVISACDIYVGGDTGMTHAAAALGKEIVGVWGDITHMQPDKSKPNNIQPGSWDSSPYVPEGRRYMLRRTEGDRKMSPIFTANQILEGVNHFLRRW